MSERSELRSRREERMENGVKNLKGSEAISQNFSNDSVLCFLTWIGNADIFISL
jgi:hypothetical protein